MTLSAIMYQNLTGKWIKPGRLPRTILMLALGLTASALAREPSLANPAGPPAALSDPTIEAEAALEQTPAVIEVNAQRLEAIDEASVTYQDAGRDVETQTPPPSTMTPLSEEVEALKKAALALNRDLLILEEELLFPANSQIVIFLSLDVGKYFSLDSVKVKIDDKLIASHLYTKRQNTALSLGGIQRLYLGNLKSGAHEVTAFFVGIGPDNREYKRGATIVVEKDEDPMLLELKIRDADSNMQPKFSFEEWQL